MKCMERALKVLKNTINIGLNKPIKLLHITDTHICLDDEDTPSERFKCFDNDFEHCSNIYFEMALEYARDNDLLIIHTGDLFDFLSQKTLDAAKRYLSDADYIYAAGNHDFCAAAADMGTGVESEAYKMRNMVRSAPYIKNNLHFYSRLVNGVNFVALDNSYYLIGEDQLQMLKYEVAKGYPVVLCMHVPIFTEKLVDKIMGAGQPCGYCCGASEEYLAKYSESRRLEQMPDVETLHAIDYIRNESAIKLVIAGHVHDNVEDTITDNLPQLVTHGSFAGFVREITLT